MTQTLDPAQIRLQKWVDRVHALADQVAQWSEAQGWTVEREDRTVEEEGVGTYHVPALRVFLKGAELLLNPKALQAIGAEGRVDLSAYPAMSRVMLLAKNGSWEIMTTSHVPLRQPWSRENFVQLVHDMSHL